jgi:CRP-like cAMP-binding protein
MNDLCTMPAELESLLFKITERMEVPRNHVLIKPGQVCDHLYYIEKGILSCHEKEKGKKIYTWLMQQGDIATSVESFNFRLPSRDTIESITDCILHTLSWKGVKSLTKSYPEFGDIRQQLTDKYHLQAREVDAQRRREPEQFYQYLKSIYGANLDLIPDKILASYMGISVATLYRHKK